MPQTRNPIAPYGMDRDRPDPTSGCAPMRKPVSGSACGVRYSMTTTPIMRCSGRRFGRGRTKGER